MNHPLAAGYANKSEFYDSARPSYPQESILFICELLILTEGLPVLDVGAGTGILTRQLAAGGMTVIGVERDRQMLAKARANPQLPAPAYRLGTAEELGAAAHSVAALVCGQSFHWFDPEKTLAEFKRVLATDNSVILIWNIRTPDGDEFHSSYEQLLNDAFPRYAETLQIDADLERRIEQFFSGSWRERTFHNSQQLSAPALVHRTLSCSYAPQPESQEYRTASNALIALHQEYQQEGLVSLNYKTRVVYGSI